VNNLKECILSREPRITAKEVAFRVGCSETDLSNYIKENRKPNSDRAIALAQVLKVRVVDIFPQAKRRFYFELGDNNGKT